MRNVCAVTSLVGTLICGAIGIAAAQSSAATSGNERSVIDTLPDAPDTAQKQKKKGGGLLGKVKGVAKNKVVQQVAKTAACTMLPGGQVVAGAIDAAANKKDGDPRLEIVRLK
jgi:hypothetical protein